jgi:hypothetical protein
VAHEDADEPPKATLGMVVPVVMPVPVVVVVIVVVRVGVRVRGWHAGVLGHLASSATLDRVAGPV